MRFQCSHRLHQLFVHRIGPVPAIGSQVTSSSDESATTVSSLPQLGQAGALSNPSRNL